jgi:hypothetical protein
MGEVQAILIVGEDVAGELVALSTLEKTTVLLFFSQPKR